MKFRFLILWVLCLFCLPVWGQITASTPPVQAPVSVNKYLPQEDLELLKELSMGEQGMPTALMIDPAFISSRLAKLQNQIPLVYNQYTHQFVEYFAFKKVDFTRRMLEKRDIYFPLYEKYLKQYNLPEELKYLSLIESGLETKAISNKGAGGLWQFMPYTARGDFGLRVDGVVDERFDPEKATEAACKYLKQLYRVFGDWHLALAAYNTGPGNVKRAIRKCGKSDFWGIYNCLPKQTRAYVPQFIAMAYMMNYNWEHAIVADKWVSKVPVDTIQVKGYLNLNLLKKFSNIPDYIFKEVNPHIMASIIPNDNRLVSINIPSIHFSYFKENRQSILDSAGYISPSQRDSLSKRIVEKLVRKFYKVKRSQSLHEVARVLGMSLAELKKLNRLRSNRVKKGKKLVYFVRVQVEESLISLDSTSKDEPEILVINKRSKGKKVKSRYHKVRAGDTLSEIADRYPGLTVSKLKKLNHLRSSTNLRLGQRLRIN
ncbi:lytic transglycosylase domain-containing protein [Aquirufa sp. 5-AUSEE-100C1]